MTKMRRIAESEDSEDFECDSDDSTVLEEPIEANAVAAGWARWSLCVQRNSSTSDEVFVVL